MSRRRGSCASLTVSLQDYYKFVEYQKLSFFQIFDLILPAVVD